MKLTTPDTASEPYTVVAPPVTISTRSIRLCGSVFTSTWLLRPAGARRRPLSITSVRLEPRPRRLTAALPLPGLLLVRPKSGVTCGMRLSASSRLGWAVVRMASRVSVDTGLGAVNSRRVMRVPVTYTSSRSPAYSSVSSWAPAAPAKAPRPSKALNRQAVQDFERTIPEDFIFYPASIFEQCEL